MSQFHRPRTIKYDKDLDIYTGVTQDNIGVTVKGDRYRQAQEAYLKAQDGTMQAELDDPDTWIGEEDGENVWTW